MIVQLKLRQTQSPPLTLIKTQRSHNLCVFSNAVAGQKDEFLKWFKEDALKTVVDQNVVMSGRHFERKDYDITGGTSIPCDYDYIGLYELVLDGAHEAEPLLDTIFDLYRSQTFTAEPAVWLYYTVTEKTGRAPLSTKPPFMSLAFANPVKGQEAVFREWYSTEHIRHALKIPTYVGSQRFELTDFQKSGSMVPGYESMTVYEQEGTIEDIIERLPELEPNAAPASRDVMDFDRFAEWVYYPLTEKLP